MQFAIGVPNVREYADPSLLVSLAVEAEEVGWHGFFLWDHLIYHDPTDPVADPWVTVAAIAQATSHVRIGVLVAALARRRPWKVAREMSTLDALSGGRMVLGAGLGSIRAEWSQFGEDPDEATRAAKLDESLEIIAGLWTGRRFSNRGPHFFVDEAVFLPTPVQRPRIPIWVAGRWPNRKPFRRAARWDGVFPTHEAVGQHQTMTVDQLNDIVEYTSSHRTASEPFDIVLEGQAREARDSGLLERFAEAGLTWWIENLGWFRGSLPEMRALIREGPPVG